MTRLVRYVVLGFFACSTIVVIQMLAVGTPTYPSLWILPVTFMAVTTMVLGTGRSLDRFRWLEYSLCALWFTRLVVIPWLMIADQASYSSIGPVPNVREYQQGVIYMAYEVFVTGGVLMLLRAYLRRHKTQTTSISFRPGSYVPQGVLVMVGGASLIFAGVRDRFSFFTSTITGTAREIVSGYDTSLNSLASLTNLSRFAIPGLLITLAVRAYRRRSSTAYPVLAMAGCVGVNLFYVATSRASFFVPLAAAIIVLALVFPEQRKLILIFAGSTLLLATVVVTQNKSFSASAETNLGDVANYLSTYLMGPKEYAIGIRAVQDFGSSVNGETLFGDIVGNVPFLSGFVDPLNRTSQFYNWAYLGANLGVGGGYIAPASIQSTFYVGSFLGPFATALGLAPAVLGMRYLQRRGQDPSLAYVAAFTVVVALLFHTNTFSTIASFIAFPIVPLIILSTFDTWLSKFLRGDLQRHERHSYSEA